MISRFFGKFLLFITNSNRLYKSNVANKAELLSKIYEQNVKTLFFGTSNNYISSYFEYI